MSAVETLFPGDGELPRLMRAKDWSATSLGPPERWPAGLRAAVRIVLTSRFSMWMAWGEDLAFLYNDAYRRDTLGAKHPRSLGMATRELWSEIWSDIAPRIDQVLADGRATWDEDLLLFLERSGYREETYHTFSYSPLHDDEGCVRGVLSVVTEETARLITERRVALLGRLAAEIAANPTEPAVLAALGRALDGDERDLPFTLTWLLRPDGTARLAASTGFGGERPPVPDEIAPDDEGPWGLRAVLRGGGARDVSLAEGGWPTGPWSVPPARVYLVPVAQQGQAEPAGVLVAGINPHRAFDDAYRDFVGLCVGQIAAGLANARAYERERQRAEMLAELDRAKTVFFSNVSHEFRTPLTLMLGPLDGLLVRPDLDPAVREELATIRRNGLRLSKLVNTILDFSRIEAGRAAATYRRVDLARLTADLASAFRAAVEQAGLRLVVECPPLDRPAAVDPDMWEKIVLNLLSNAFKFTLQGEIGVAVARHGDLVRLVVRDTGSGIPAESLPRLFDRFHRVEGTPRRTHEGTGIGLALVQELVRLHGGTIEVESILGRGTTFTVSVPLREAVTEVAELPPAPGHAEAYVGEALRWLPDVDSAGGDSPHVGVNRHVLVVDDNADMRDYLRRILGPRCEVSTASNGRIALERLRERRPDLVVSDVMMPDLDGFELLAAIRADAELAGVPVLLVSGRAGEEARVEGIEAGATDYVVKPFSARELVAKVEALLLRAEVRAVEERQARRLAAIFEQAPVAIAILRGPDHVFEIANRPYRDIVGQRDVVGVTVAEALPEVVAQGFVDLLDRVYRTGEPFVGRSVPIRLAVGPTLEERYFDLIYQPLLDDEGRVNGIAAIGHDVTELATARRAADTANRTKDDFLAMLGHELRNPLAPITTALQVLRMRGGGGDRTIAVIERQVAHLVSLVDDLLDISRITRGKVELRPQRVDVAEIVDRSVELVAPLLESQRHALTVQVPPGLFVQGDPARLAQVFSNLLSNAAKYTPPGGNIAVAAVREGDEIALRVQDDGVGIDAAMLSRVFEPFAQAKQARDRSRGGLGLGLAIVDSLVRLHDGTVSVASDGPGAGSTFVVRLPAAAATPQAVPEPATAPVARPVTAAPILIVDDNVDAAEMLREYLTLAGWSVEIAHDGPSALAAARRQRPRVAVLDLGLPVMDGFEVAHALRGDPELPAPRLVAVTGYGQPRDREQTRAAGFAAHLVKPVDVEHVRGVIQRLLDEEQGE